MEQQTVTAEQPGSGERRRPRIVVGVDGSPSSVAALRWAGRMADLLGAHIEAVTVPERASSWYGYSTESHIVSPHDDATRSLHDAVTSAFGDGDAVHAGPDVRETVLAGRSPAEALVAAAHGAELLVVGSTGRANLTGMLLGSVSTACAEHADCPVVVVPGGGTH